MKLVFFIFYFAVIVFGVDGINENFNQNVFSDGIVYRYEAQIATGIDSLTINSQRSVIKFSANVVVLPLTNNSIVLQFENIEIGSMNGEFPNIYYIQLKEFFYEEEIDDKKLSILELSFKVDYENGIVKNIYFNKRDETWSKNVKRGVLNLFQVNLTPSNSHQSIKNMTQIYEVEDNTVEGKCEVKYSIIRFPHEEGFTVTKNINFEKCAVLSNLTSTNGQISDLHRSTVIKFELNGNENNFTFANVELLSQYLNNISDFTSLQTVIVSRLTFFEKRKLKGAIAYSHASKKETLIFSDEWDRNVKRFYQYGDKEFTNQNLPFSFVQNKGEIIQSVIRKTAESTKNKLSEKHLIMLQDAIRIIRMCTKEEIKTLFEKVKGRELEILIDACAVAGTYNTVHLLVDQIQKEEISPIKAITILYQFNNLPAISEPQVKVVMQLCQHRNTKKSSFLYQACWLTVGSMINKLCKEKDVCLSSEKYQYDNIIWHQYKNARNIYEKILFLKTLGNAGLIISAKKIEKVVFDESEVGIIRTVAIDILQRLSSDDLYIYQDNFDQKEQIFLNWASMFSNTNDIPKYSSISFKWLFEKFYKNNSVNISIDHSNLESYYNEFMNHFYGDCNEHICKEKAEIQSIFEAFKIRTNQIFENNSFAFMGLRINNADQAIVPLGEEYIPAFIMALVDGESLLFNNAGSSLLKSKQLKLFSTFSFTESSCKIPTASGFSIEIHETLLAAIAMESKIEFSRNYNANIKLKSLISINHAQKMEINCPIINIGTQNLQSLSVHFPVNMEVLFNNKKSVKFIFHVPEQNINIVKLQSLTTTYKYTDDPRFAVYDKILSKRNVIPFNIFLNENCLVLRGHYYHQNQIVFDNIYNIFKSTDNYAVVNYVCHNNCTKIYELTVAGKLFEKVNASIVEPNFEKSNLSSLNNFPVSSMEEIFKSDIIQEIFYSYHNSQYRRRTAYHHKIEVSFKTYGDILIQNHSMQLNIFCNSEITFCKLNINTVCKEGTQIWTLKTEAQILLPEYVHHQFSTTLQTFNNLAISFAIEWGNEKMQRINLKVYGTSSNSQHSCPSYINKYYLGSEYEIFSTTETEFETIMDRLRLWNYLNVGIYKVNESQDNKLFATFVIDSCIPRYVNITLKTPTELVKFNAVKMPTMAKSFALLQPQIHPLEIHSVKSGILIQNYSECRIDDSKIETFDSFIFKSAIKSCYTVISADCSKKSFIILMKNDTTTFKSIKGMTFKSKNAIELKFDGDKAVAEIGGKTICDEDELQKYDIYYFDKFVQWDMLKGVVVQFDGEKVVVILSQFYKNSICGICGNFNDKHNDEFLMNKGSFTSDIKNFYSSFSIHKCSHSFENESLNNKSTKQNHRRIENDSGFKLYYNDSKTDDDETFLNNKILYSNKSVIEDNEAVNNLSVQNGDEAKPHSYPFMVFIQGPGRCGGTVSL